MNSFRNLSRQQLQDWAQRILQALGTPPDKASLVAESLVAANLRGVDSHGVHLLPYYAEHLRRGLIKPDAEPKVVSESAACAVFDGRQAFGQVVSEAGCAKAVQLAGEHGLGMVVARNSNHFGAAAFWGQRISEAGMIGLVMCNASPSVPPWQGREGRFGTNPICISVPSAPPGGWLLDMATTTVAKNKIFRALHNQEPEIPPGWAMDDRGVPTTKTEDAKLLMPLGGYKGSGLGMLIEILCGVLGGGVMSTAVGGTYIFDRPMLTSQMFLAIGVDRFLPRSEFQARMEYLVRLVKSAAPAEGYDEVMVAGDPEWRIEAERLETGIPIDEGTWERFEEVADSLGVAMPA